MRWDKASRVASIGQGWHSG